MNLARTLAGLAVRVAPAERRKWAEAVRAELDHLPHDRAIAFAVGGLSTALRLRLTAAPFVTGVTRWSLAAAALAWCLLKFRLAGRLDDADHDLPASLTVAAAVFGAGALITAVFGLRLTTLLLRPALAVAAAYALAAFAFTPESSGRRWQLALALEDVTALTAALVIALAAQAYAARRSTSLP